LEGASSSSEKGICSPADLEGINLSPYIVLLWVGVVASSEFEGVLEPLFGVRGVLAPLLCRNDNGSIEGGMEEVSICAPVNRGVVYLLELTLVS
jgi:hypothetical protein